MNLSPLAQSADKQVLFARLGLNEQTHRTLLQDAQGARDSLSRNPVNLTDQSRAAYPSLQPPYKWDEISETAKHREILTIVNNAQPPQSYYYAMGRYQTTVAEENWVARWYLWHSFRYRDNRDTRSRAVAETGGGGYGHGGPGSYGGGSDGNWFWDPVHNTWRRKEQ